MLKANIPLLTLVLSSFMFLELSAQSVNWYQEETNADKPYNIGTDEAYDSFLQSRSGKKVVVAVIDSGIDIEHEDLKDVIWVNSDEVPGNGIDDDGNGYVDDVNGWNFIGGADGSHVDADTYEMTRSYALLKKRFDGSDGSGLKGDDLADYNRYVTYKKRVDKEIKNAKAQYDEFKPQADFFTDVLARITDIRKEEEITKTLVASYASSLDREEQVIANIFNFYDQETGTYPSDDELYTDLLSPLDEAVKHFGDKFKYNWNPDYDPRSIIGDNYSDKKERHYGNNLVEGPDAQHGTHVAGIIAAQRDNKLGLNGVAHNTEIMVIRAVPNGDERDKDVANAIRYAVDNGASIINMSFGKGESPEKEIVDDAVRYAEKKDVLIVHAAGNSSENVDISENYPDDHYRKPKGFLFFKKKQPKNYITIGASGPSSGQDMAAEFSNYGPKDVDLFAPGVMILSTVPDDGYEVLQGTSMAAPVVSGIAALVRSYFPNLSAKQVKEVLMAGAQKDDRMVLKPGSADKLVPFSSLSVTGGIIDVKAVLQAASQR